jgi:hypothetical protein
MNAVELADNPFFVLEVSPSATRMEVERAGQKLLAQLAIGVASAKKYPTPFGMAERDETKVRTALSALRDPEQRVLYELWVADSNNEPQSDPLPSWPGALGSIGWRGPWAD